ncbi:MAG: DinB family protein [Dehalococcoidia bacterium]
MTDPSSTATSRDRFVVDPPDGVAPEIGGWLWALDDARRRTKDSLRGLDTAVLDWVDAASQNSIGTLLAHIVAIEMDWLYVEGLEQSIPPDVLALLPPHVRDEQGRLMAVPGITLDEHLARLDAARVRLRLGMGGLGAEEFRRVRHFPHYDVTPEWVLHHLTQHEAEHRGEIMAIRVRAERALGST